MHTTLPQEEVMALPTMLEPPLRPSWLAWIEQQRARLALGALAGALLGFVAAIVLPPTYSACARLYVVPGDDPTAPHGAGIDVVNATLPLVLAVLRSQRVADETIVDLHLDAAWSLSLRKARQRLDERLTVTVDRKANLLTVAFEDRAPARARAVAATLAERATALSIELWAKRNREHRRKLEAELSDVSASLGAAESAFRVFREQAHVVDLPGQVKATVEQAAALQQRRVDKELELRLARAFGDGAAIEVQKQRRERAALVLELDKLRHGDADRVPLLPLDEVPRLEGEYARLKRSVDEQAARHELLAMKVSELVAAEARPGGRAEVIDPPLEPQAPSGPSIGKLTVAGTIVGALVAGALVLVAAWLATWTRRRHHLDDEVT